MKAEIVSFHHHYLLVTAFAVETAQIANNKCFEFGFVVLTAHHALTSVNLNSLQEHLGLGSLPDYAIAGLSVTELPNFFRGYAISLATQLSRIQAEVIRIGGLRAFSDRQTVMIEVDEDENIRKSCIRQFSLPINERLLLKARCFQQENGGKGQKIRLVMLANHVVFDPAFFGPTISANAQLFPCHQVCFKSCFRYGSILPYS